MVLKTKLNGLSVTKINSNKFVKPVLRLFIKGMLNQLFLDLILDYVNFLTSVRYECGDLISCFKLERSLAVKLLFYEKL